MSDKPDGKSWLSMRVLTLAIILAAAYPISATLMAYLDKIRALGDAVDNAQRGVRMSILAEWGDGTTSLIFYIAILLTGLAFEIMGFRLVAIGFRAPKSTVLFHWGEKKFQMTQVVPGVAIAFIGACLVIGGFYLIHSDVNASASSDIRERDIREVECTYLSGGSLGTEAWVLTVYGNGHGLLKVDAPHSRSVLFMMNTRIRDLLGALVQCDVRHLPSEIGEAYMHEEVAND